MTLKKAGHHSTGTVRSNRVEKAPLRTPQVMKNESRGTYQQVTDQKSDITLVRYNNNNVVTVASICHGVAPMGSASR